MKLLKYTAMMLCSLCALSGCSGLPAADVYTLPVDPYKYVNEDDVRFGECTISFGSEVNVAGQGAWYEGNDILISKGGTYKISGSYDGGCIKIDTPDIVKLVFSNADISNPNGCAIESAAQRLIIATDGTNTLTGNGGDRTAISSDGALLILGMGAMSVNGDVFSRGGIRFGHEVSTICEIIRTENGDLIKDALNVR